MPKATAGDELSASRNVTVILRLVLDAHGQLVRGEIVDVDGGLWRRFSGWQGLSDALRAWVRRHERDGDRPGDA